MVPASARGVRGPFRPAGVRGQRPCQGLLLYVHDLISAYLCASFMLGDQMLTGGETLAQGCTAGVRTRVCSSPGLLTLRGLFHGRARRSRSRPASLPTFEICDLGSPRIHFLLQKAREIPSILLEVAVSLKHTYVNPWWRARVYLSSCSGVEMSSPARFSSTRGEISGHV